MLCLSFSNNILAQGLSLQLTPAVYGGGYHVSYFGAKNGSIDLTVTGGTPPYAYSWSHDATTEDVSGLAAGYYHVLVTDANEMEAQEEITLNYPEELGLDVAVSNYSNGYNVSCNGCFNGFITLTPYGGHGPYTFQWEDGPTSQSRYILDAGSYQVNVTDANGAEISSDGIILMEPASTDWTMTGNSGSNPNTQFIGTLDSVDLVFKTNNSEVLRLKSTGDLQISNYTGSSGLLSIDSSGNLLRNAPCSMQGPAGTWNTGNYLMWTCPTFQVGIGTSYVPQDYILAVEGNVICEEVYVKERGLWPDYVFENDYKLESLPVLKTFIKNNKHLPGIPSSDELSSNKKAGLAEMQKLQMEKIEELHLYILQLHERIEKLEQRNGILKK